MKNPARLKLARKTIRPAIVLTTPQLKTQTKTRTTKSERLAYQLEQIEQLWLDMDEFPFELDGTEEVATALRAAQGDPTDKAKLKALATALHGLDDEMWDNLRVTPQDCFNLAVGLEKLCK